MEYNILTSKCKSGIYIITNSVNHKIYVGSTQNFTDRFTQHKSDLKNLRHNRRFQNFVNKYGIECLKFNLLEEVEDLSQLLIREQFYLDSLECWKSRKGFNINKFADSIRGIKMPKSHCEATRKRMMGNTITKGRKLSEQHSKKISDFWKNNPERLAKMKNQNRLSQLNVDRTKYKKGKIIEVYFNNVLIDTIESLKEVCKKYNLTHSCASKTLKGRQKSTKGYSLISKGFYFYTN